MLFTEKANFSLHEILPRLHCKKPQDKNDVNIQVSAAMKARRKTFRRFPKA